MVQEQYLEDYFVKISKNFGINKVEFSEDKVTLDPRCIRNMVFASDDFDAEFEHLILHCQLLHQKLQRGFSLKIKRDLDDHYRVLLL